MQPLWNTYTRPYICTPSLWNVYTHLRICMQTLWNTYTRPYICTLSLWHVYTPVLCTWRLTASMVNDADGVIYFKLTVEIVNYAVNRQSFVTVTPLFTVVIYGAIFEWRRMCTTLIHTFTHLNAAALDSRPRSCLPQTARTLQTWPLCWQSTSELPQRVSCLRWLARCKHGLCADNQLVNCLLLLAAPLQTYTHVCEESRE